MAVEFSVNSVRLVFYPPNAIYSVHGHMILLQVSLGLPLLGGTMSSLTWTLTLLNRQFPRRFAWPRPCSVPKLPVVKQLSQKDFPRRLQPYQTFGRVLVASIHNTCHERAALPNEQDTL